MCGSRKPVRCEAGNRRDPESIRDLAFSIIRVLDRNGDAVGPRAGMLRIRHSLFTSQLIYVE